MVQPKKVAVAAAGLSLVLMAVLMFIAARDDSATVDETQYLASGYTYWTGHRYYFVPEHPPLGQLLFGAPLAMMDIKLSDADRALINKTAGYSWAIPWDGAPRALTELFPDGRTNWYFLPNPEGQIFGQMLVYSSGNDADKLLLAGRCVQILLTLITGGIIWYWTRSATQSDWLALVAMWLWVFNPNALGHGHLVTTDIGVTFGMSLALLRFTRLLEKPSARTAALCGVATGIALILKHTAISLGPIYVLLLIYFWKRWVPLGAKKIGTLAGVMTVSVWAVIMLVYFPMWSPAPPLPVWQAAAIGVPGWFQTLRPILIPAGYFKSLGMAFGHSAVGHHAYLLGHWSQLGWWYFYPVVFFVKLPLAFVILTVLGVGLAARHWKSLPVGTRVAWLAVAGYMATVLTSNVNIGVRHILPIFPWLCVGIATATGTIKSVYWRRGLAALLAWQAAVVLWASPLYIQFCSEAVGGARNGYKYFYDSNYDWGQDAKRLKQFLDERGIQSVYLDYFGTQFSVDYLGIHNTRVTTEQAKTLRSGYLVVSSSELVAPEWDWLRTTRQPMARVAYTLFVYQLP